MPSKFHDRLVQQVLTRRRAVRGARVLAVGITASSVAFALRAATNLPKTPFRVGNSPKGWLGDGNTTPTELAVANAPSRGELFFIDADIADPKAFWLAAPAGGTVVCIPSGIDSWQFMAQEAEHFRGLRAIHIISHGEPGALVLNRRRYTAADLNTRSEALHQIGRALCKNGDILLYGCDTGEGEAGLTLVNRLAEFTGADVGASSNPTGGVPGADWNLEVVHGHLAAAMLAPATYPHELNTLTVTSNADSGAGTLRNTIAAAVSGDTIAFSSSMTITLTSGALAIGKSLTIEGDVNGDGTPDVTIDANYNSQVIQITSGTVSLDGLTIEHGLISGNGGRGGTSQDGSAGGDALGAGLSITGGTVTITHSVITQNVSAAGGGGTAYAGGTSNGGGGGGGFSGKGGGNGGGNYSSTSGVAGGSGTGGNGVASGYTGGFGGGTTGGAGGASGYYAGGTGATASASGFGSIGGGGGAAGTGLQSYAAGKGGTAVGGLFIGSGAIVYLVNTTLSQNLGAGGGGAGGTYSTNGANGGTGVGAIDVQGTLHYQLSTVTISSNNSGVGGGGGTGGPGKSNGTTPGTQNGIFGTADSTYVTPTVTAGATVSYTEQGSAATLDSTLNVTDSSSSTLANATVTIKTGFFSGDTLVATTTGTTIAASYDGTTGILTLTGSDTLAHYKTVLESVTFSSTSHNPTNFGTDTSRSISWVTSDGFTKSSTVTSTVNITAVNDAPALASAGSTDSYTELGAAATIESGITVSDVDNQNLASATVTISAGYFSGDTLAATTAGTSIVASFNSGTGALTLSGSDTLAHYQTVLRSITFSSTSHNPTNFGADTSRTISWVVNDGTANSSAVTSTVNITAVNDAPVLGSAGSTDSYTELGAATTIESGITVSDVDNQNLASATASISAGFIAGDTLNFSNQNGITGSYNSGTGVLTLSGSASLANYQTALRSITFNSSNHNPTNFGADTSRTISWVVNDGTANSSAVTSTVNITAVNDAPTVTVGGGATPAYIAGGSAAAVDNALTVTDVDSANLASATVTISGGFLAGDTLAVTVTGTSILASYNSGTGVLTLSGSDTVAHYQTVLRTLTFSSSATDPTNGGLDLSRTLSIVANDGSSSNATSNTATETVNVAAFLVTAGGGAAANFTELGSAVVVDGGVTIEDTGVATLASATITISANFQTGDVLAADTTGTAITASFNSSTHVLSLSGSDTIANYQAVMRLVTFANPTNHNPANFGAALTRTVTFIANDGTLTSSTATRTVNITAINDAPVVTAPGTGLAYTEGGSAAVIDSGVTVSDVDNTNLASATITISAGFLAGDTLAATTAGTSVVASYNSGTGVLTLSGSDTLAHYQTVLESVTYMSTSSDPTNVLGGGGLDTTRTISWVVDDGSASNHSSNTATSTVTITSVDNAPTDIALSNATVNQSAGVNASVGTLSSTDVDSISFTYSLVAGVGSTNNASFNLSGSTLRANNAAALPGGAYSVRVQTDDGSGGTFSKSFAVTVVDNVPPTVSSVAVPANATYIVGQSLDFTVNWSEAVVVIGTPQLALTIGTSTVHANYLSGSGTSALVFRYTIQTNDQDTDGIAIGALTLNGGSIKDAATNAATLTLNGVGSTTAVLVDGVPPSVSSINRLSPASATTNATSVQFAVTFSENVTGVDSTDFTLTTTGTAGTISSVTGSGASYTVTVNSVTGDGTLRLDLKSSGTGIADLAGNAITAGFTSGQSYTIDHTAPTVTSVAVPANATYINGQHLDFTINFSEAVTVDTTGGTPSLGLTIGSTSQSAGYLSGTGTAALVFRYSIQGGDLDTDGITIGVLALNGGTIQDIATNNATLALNGVGSTTAVLVDAVAPTVSSINTADQTPTHATTVHYTVTFSKSVTGVSTAAFTLTPFSTATGSITGVTGSGGSYTVTVGSVAGDGTLRLDLKSSGTGITDVPGNPISGGFTSGQSYTIDNTAPTVLSVSVPANATYIAGQNLDFTVNWSENVTVTGTPQIALTIGSTSVHANYLSGSGTSALVFRYTVQNGDLDSDGIAVGALSLNGGTINDAAGNSANLTLNSVGATTSVLVDGVAPSVSSINRQVPATSATNATSVTFRVTFSRTVSGVGPSAFTLTPTSTAAGSIGAVATVSGSVYDVTVTSITGNGTLRLDLKSSGTGITDTPGNPISGGFTSGQVYTIDTTAPTVSSIVRESPATVNTSATSVTYRATFSENVTGVAVGGFALTAVSGNPAGTIATVTPVSGSVYDVAVNSVTGNGELRLDLQATGTGITDTVGNAIGGGFTTGDFYVVGNANVFDSVSLAAGTTRTVSNVATTLVAQRFTTAATEPLTLTTVAAAIGNIAGTPAPVVTIHSDNAGAPGATVVATLTNPGALTANALNVWTGTAVLNASTTYWVEFADSSGSGAYDVHETAATTGGVGAWLGNADYAYFYGVNLGTGPQAGALQIGLGAVSTPTITSTLTASATYGSAFGGYTITATNSPNSYSASGLPTGLTLTPSTGVIAGTPTQSGTFNVTLAATNGSGTGAPSTLVLTVAKVGLTVSGITANNKVYDRTTAATLTTTSAALNGVVTGDVVTLDASGAVAAFADKLVATGKTVTISGLTLGGGSAGNYTLTQPTAAANITAKPLTVTGITASNKTYDGSTTATINVAGATLVGVVTGDAVTLSTAGATGAFADANAASGKTVTISGLSLSGGDAANYSLTAPTATASINPAGASVTLGNLAQTYDGTPKAATVTVNPPAPASVTYNGSATPPTNAGSYSVIAQVSGNFAGSASGTLVVAQATQTINFPSAPPAASVALSAVASSGLPVTYMVLSGTGSISGTTLTIVGSGAVVVRASQPGNANYAAAFADQTFNGTPLLSQTINFAAIADRPLGTPPLHLAATASSGLPVTFSVTSGHAIIVAGNLLVLTGTGSVTVQASQAGNSTYAPATVSQTFNVLFPRIFLGDCDTSGTNQKVGDIGAYLPPTGNSGTLLITISNPSVNGIVNFQLQSDGTFSGTVATSVRDALTRTLSPRAIGTSPLVVHGMLVGNVLSGSIDGVNVQFTANLQSPDGPDAAIAGLYESADLNTNGGVIASILDAQGGVVVVVSTPTITTGGTGTVTLSGSFSVQPTGGGGGVVNIVGAVDSTTATVSGTVTMPNATPITFSGLNTLAPRNDRLINLSSRVSVGTGDQVLISGFVIGGSSPKQVLVRGIGPGLTSFGVTGVLANPRIRLYDATGQVIAQNDDWGSTTASPDIATAESHVGAFALQDGGTDAAMLATLSPGAYSVQVDGNGGTGVALAEIYDASADPLAEYQRLVNISSRGLAGPGAGALIGGFVVTGNASKHVLIRGIGPTLGSFGVSGVLADPRITVYASDGTVIAQNDDWGTPQTVGSNQTAATAADIAAAATATGAFALPTGSKDAAVVITLAPGAYTAQVSSSGATGVALVEIYEIPEN